MGRLRIEALAPEGIGGKRLRVKGQDVKVILTTDDGTEVNLTKELAIKAARWTVDVDSRGSYASAQLSFDGVEIIADIDERDLKVKCDETNNTPKDIEAGRINVEVEMPRPVHERLFPGYIYPGKQCTACSWDNERLVAACAEHRVK